MKKENEKKSSLISTFFDRLTFFHIFLLWTGAIFLFGICYHYFSSTTSFLYYNLNNQLLNSLSDSIYFSFITATSTGFGDIIPFGLFKIMAIIEVVFGLVLLALVTSKIVSIKQNMILSEIYDISLKERVNRMRSSLFLFRQTMARIINNIEDNAVKKRDLNDLYIYFSSFEDTLTEIKFLLTKSNEYSREVDLLSLELLLTSIVNSLDKLNELINTMNEHQLEWKRDVAVNLIQESLKLSDEIFENCKGSNLPDATKNHLCERKTAAVDNINQAIAA